MVAAVCTLALAIGANAAVFTVVDKVLLHSLPIERAERVVVIWPRERANPTTIGEISYATFRTWREGVPGLENLAAIGSTNWSLILREGEPATIPVAAVSGSFFSLLGTSASLGRTLLPEDDERRSSRVAVMSHGFWVRRFGAEAGIVGRALRFHDAVYTIVGVLPDGFAYPRGAELWVPLVPQLMDASKQWNIDVLAEPGFGVLFVLGRLDPRIGLDATRANVSALIARDAGGAFRPGMEAVLTPLDEHIFGNTRQALIALVVCVAFVLIIGCANVAVLLLVRATTRAQEIATRLALGATRWCIVRQSLTDALVLTTFGGVVGVVLANADHAPTQDEFEIGQFFGAPIHQDRVGMTEVIVNVFDGGPHTTVEYRIGEFPPVTMRRETRPDPFIREVFARNQATKKPWAQVEPCSHIWTARLPADLKAGTHCIRVRVVDEYGREHLDRLCMEVTGAPALRG